MRERGEINFGCIISLIILAVAVVVVVKVVPIVVNVGDFSDAVVAQAERASLPRHNNEYIRDQLAQAARNLRLPVEPSQIKVERGGNEVHIHVEFDKQIVLPFYTYTWHKVIDERRPTF